MQGDGCHDVDVVEAMGGFKLFPQYHAKLVSQLCVSMILDLMNDALCDVSFVELQQAGCSYDVDAPYETKFGIVVGM